MNGTVNIARTIWSDAAFKDEPFTEREAFVWMIMEASWKPREKRVGSATVFLERGQLSHSIRFLAEAWGWKRNKTHRFITRLKNRDMIGTESGTGVLVITIRKYDEFQAPNGSEGTGKKPKRGQRGDSAGTARGQTRTSDETSDETSDLGKKETPNGVSQESDETEPENDDGKPDETAEQLDDGPGEDPAKPEPKAAKPKAEPKRRIAEDRQPDHAAIAYAGKLGVDVRRTWPDFVDYHIRRDTTATERGFAAAWRTWCRKAVEFAERDKRMAGTTRNGKPADWLEAFAMAEREADGNRANTREAGLWGDDEGGLDTTGQVLPFGRPSRA